MNGYVGMKPSYCQPTVRRDLRSCVSYPTAWYRTTLPLPSSYRQHRALSGCFRLRRTTRSTDNVVQATTTTVPLARYSSAQAASGMCPAGLYLARPWVGLAVIRIFHWFAGGDGERDVTSPTTVRIRELS